MTATPTNDVVEGQRNTLARNFSVMMGSQVTTFIISMAATVVIPRYLGAEVIGRFQLALAIWAIGQAVIGFGMDLAITKAVARDHGLVGHLWATGIVARCLIAVPVTIVLFAYALAIDYSDEVLFLLVILTANAIVVAAAEVSHDILMGLERMGPASAAAVASRIIAVGGAVCLLLLGFDVYAVAMMMVIGSIASLAVLGVALRRAWATIDSDIGVSVTRSGIVALLKDSHPYFWVFFFMIVYQQVDIVVISLVVEDDAVLGWYSVYDRLANMLMFLPSVFMSVVFPTLSRLYGDINDEDRAAHGLLTQRTFKLMLLLSVPAGFGLSVISRPFIELVFGMEFSNAAPIVAIGGVVVSLTYLNTIFGMFLISMDKERSLSIFIGIGAALTIPLDIFLVPFFQAQLDNGAIGGVVAYAITESVILMGVLHLMPRGALGPGALSYTVRVVAAGAIMAATIYPLRELFLVVPIVAGALVFGLAVAVLRVTTSEDRDIVRSAIPDRFLPSSMR